DGTPGTGAKTQRHGRPPAGWQAKACPTQCKQMTCWWRRRFRLRIALFHSFSGAVSRCVSELMKRRTKLSLEMKLARCALILALAAAALDGAPRIQRIQLSITNPA